MSTPRNTSRRLIDESPLLVLPSLATILGLHEAIVLQQIHYWLQSSKHDHDGRRWLYNSYPDWAAQFPFLTVNQIRRAIEHLEDKGLLLVGNYNSKGFDRTKWYSIDYDVLDSLELPATPDDPSGKIASPSGTDARRQGTHARAVGTHAPATGIQAGPIPETNAETTTKTNTKDRSSVATPQAPQPLARGRGAQRDMGRDIPLVAPDYDYKALWAAIEQHTERKLLWNYAIETQAVKRIVKAYPAATPEELIGFLAYLETVFPWSQDPTKQVTFSEGAKHFARWYSDGQPTTVTQKGRITHVRTYDDPDAINAEIQALAAAERAAERDVPGYRAEPVPLRRRA